MIGPAARRLHRHLLLVALDLPDQHPDRRCSASRSRCASSRTCASRARSRSTALGFAIVSLGLGGTMFGFENVGRGILPNEWVAALIIGGVVLLALYAWHARRVIAPILDIALFRVRTFRAVGGRRLRLPHGHRRAAVPDAADAAARLRPVAVRVGHDHVRGRGRRDHDEAHGARRSCARSASARVLLSNTGVCARLDGVPTASSGPSTPHALIIGVLLVGGFFRSLQFTSLNTLAYAEIDPPHDEPRDDAVERVGSSCRCRSASGWGALCCTRRSRSAAARGSAPTTLRRPTFAIVRSARRAGAAVAFLPLPRDAGAEISGWREAKPEAVARARPRRTARSEPGQRSARFTSRAAAFCGRAISPD